MSTTTAPVVGKSSTRRIAIDFEFYNSNEKDMRIVCAVVHEEGGDIFRFNTLTEIGLYNLQAYFNLLGENEILVSYAAIAEARSLLSIGIDPLKYKWVDLYVEFIMLCNSNNRYCYGNYLDADSTIRYSVPPNVGVEDNLDHSECPKNLLNALYKMLGIQDMSLEYKHSMRDIILSKDDSLVTKHMDEILQYCEEDTINLLKLDDSIRNALYQEGLRNFREDQYARGMYAVCTALCERGGIPIDILLLQNVIDKTPDILEQQKGMVNEHFPFFVAGHQKPDKLRKNGAVFRYKYTEPKKDMSAYQSYVGSLQIESFPTTAGGKYKSDKDTLEEFGYWGGLEALWKYNKTESSLKWFSKDNKNGFFDRFGSDNCVRPYYGIFGTQTGRNAAKAKTFPLAMSSWLRAIIRPNPNSYIIGCDFSQQEVYIAAVLSRDENLLNAYNTGDVYLAFAKQAGLVPESATKSSHKLQRDLCKATVLGLQFGMGKDKLRTKLTLDSGTQVSMETTMELIQAHKKTFKIYWKWVYDTTSRYKSGQPLITSDGWVLFQDNPVITSVRNFLVQGTGASITRKAIELSTLNGLHVMCGLHDAIYSLSTNPEIDELRLKIDMLYATEYILGEKRTDMRIDCKVIGHAETWVEEKGQKDWDKLKGFLA